MQNQEDKKLLLHVCCGICSAYPISLLQDMGYSLTAFFYNPNIYPKSEYEKRLDAERTLCSHFGVELVEGEYESDVYFEYVKGLEHEPEKGARCDKCFELRLYKTARLAKQLGIENFTTSMVISPHKNFQKLSQIGSRVGEELGLNYLAVDFKKKDGFLKTNKISRELSLYRQNYCGCKFSFRNNP